MLRLVLRGFRAAAVEYGGRQLNRHMYEGLVSFLVEVRRCRRRHQRLTRAESTLLTRDCPDNDVGLCKIFPDVDLVASTIRIDNLRSAAHEIIFKVNIHKK